MKRYPREEVTFDPVTHRYYDAGGHALPSVTSILRAAGFMDMRHIPQEALDRGTDVHRMVEGVIKTGTVANVQPFYVPYAVGWMAFLADTGFVPKESEIRVCHSLYGYAGTLDIFGVMPIVGPGGKRLGGATRTIIELKSGSSPWWVRYQLAGYAATFTPVPRRFSLVLPGNNQYRLTEYKDPTDINVFLSALTVRNVLAEQSLLPEGL